MFSIRSQVFETNSSSVHAICVSSKNMMFEEHIVAKCGYYGWEDKKYQDTVNRFQYLYAMVYRDPDKLERFQSLLQELNVTYEIVNEDDHAYVDHDEEAEDFVSYVLDNPANLANWLFSSESYVKTGNDNSDCCPPYPWGFDGEIFMKGN